MNPIALETLLIFTKTKGFDTDNIRLLQNNPRVMDYILDEKMILRLSESALGELDRLQVVRSVKFTQKVFSSGETILDNQRLHYAIISYAFGDDFYSSIRALDTRSLMNIGKDIFDFICDLHKIKGDAYDIGFYIPTIPKQKTSWKIGHINYCAWLQENIENIPLDFELQEMIQKAFQYIHVHIDVLKTESGAVFLHNDLHPKNIIIHQKSLSGIIDFECAQFGERDFELAHLIHWTIFPPDKVSSFDACVKEIIRLFQEEKYVENLFIRQTIYQLEHEINQLIWSNGSNQKERTSRIKAWLNGIIKDRLI